jgi:hypothetical protein
MSSDNIPWPTNLSSQNLLAKTDNHEYKETLDLCKQ